MAINKGLHTGDMIKDMIERSGMTKTMAAAALEIAPSRITILEKQKDCRVSTLAEIADVLGYNIVIRKKSK